MSSPLADVVLFFSAALPKELEGTGRGLDLTDLVTVLLVGVVQQGGRVVFGGHPSVTPLVHYLVDHGAIPREAVTLYMPRFFDGRAPLQGHDTAIFVDRRLVGRGASPDDPEAFADDLTEMRRAMIEGCTAGFFVGGQTKAFRGRVPGIEEEWHLFRSRHPDAPAFVCGLLEGYCRETLVPSIRSEALPDPSGLPIRRRNRLFDTTDVEEASAIVLGQLGRFTAR